MIEEDDDACLHEGEECDDPERCRCKCEACVEAYDVLNAEEEMESGA